MGSWTKAVVVGPAAMFVLTGVAHFVPPLRRDVIAIVLPALPTPGLLVTITECWSYSAPGPYCYPPLDSPRPFAFCC